MNLGEIHVFDVVCRVVILDLSTGPVEAFDLDDFSVGNFSAGGN